MPSGSGTGTSTFTQGTPRAGASRNRGADWAVLPTIPAPAQVGSSTAHTWSGRAP